MEMRDDDDEEVFVVFEGVEPPFDCSEFEFELEFEDDDVVLASPRSLFVRVIMILISCDLLFFENWSEINGWQFFFESVKKN